MTTAFMIPFNQIIEQAFILRDQKPDLTIDELVREILSTVNIKIESTVPMNIRKKTIDTEEHEKERKRQEISNDERCMARTVYEKEHLDENGFLKVMREDSKNQYGDRCKCRKKDSSLFCTRHTGYQSLGVWNGEYSGKLQGYVDKTVNASVCQILDDDEEPPKPIVKEKKQPLVKSETPKKERMVKPAPKPVEDVEANTDNISDEETVDAYPITIDGIEFNIDESNNVWTDDGELVGVYDRKANTWLAKA
jgi:hypothetical protein